MRLIWVACFVSSVLLGFEAFDLMGFVALLALVTLSMAGGTAATAMATGSSWNEALLLFHVLFAPKNPQQNRACR